MAYQINIPSPQTPIDNIFDSVKQNFKSLLLTIPAEKVSDPNFGVGLPKYLFEYPTELLKQEIRQNILEQTSRYLPYISIQDINYLVENEKLLISINFTIGNNLDPSNITIISNNSLITAEQTE